MSDEQQEVWKVIRESNRARIAAATHELSALLDPEVVELQAGLSGRVVGREAVMRSVEDQNHHTRIEAFDELEHSIDVFGDLALVTYRYELRMRPVAEEDEREESGQEVIALRRAGGAWRVLWRTRLGD